MTAEWLGLNGKTVLLTGGAGGLGRAIAAGFLAAGARVALIDHDVAGGCDAVAALGGTDVSFAQADLGDSCSCAAVVDELAARFGAPDILINNAAMSAPAPLAELDLTRLDRQIDVNLIGCLAMAQAFRLRSQGRSNRAIVNVASISGSNPQPNGGGYSVAKAGLLMLTKQLAQEWGPEGIRTNAVSPGLFITPISEKFYRDPAARKRREEVVPLRRIGAVEELADTVVFLSSPRASYVNGAELTVDGGFSNSLMSHIPRDYS